MKQRKQLLLSQLFFILLLHIAGIVYAQDSLCFKTFTMGGGSREFGMCGTRISDDRAVLFNITSNCNTATCNHGMAAFLIDGNGNMIRSKKIGAIQIDVDPHATMYTQDGNILTIGYYQSSQRLLLKLDTFFNVIWTRALAPDPFMSSSNLYNQTLLESGGNYHIVFGNQWFVFSPNGNSIRSKKYSTTANIGIDRFVNFRTIQELTPNRYLLGGEIQDVPGYTSSPLAIIIDAEGNIIRKNKFKLQNLFSSTISFSAIIQPNQIMLFGTHDKSLFSTVIDTMLNVTNFKKYDGTVLPNHHVSFNKVDRFVITSYESGIAKLATFGTDINGQVLWSKFLKNGSGFYTGQSYAIDPCHFGIYSSTRVDNSFHNKGFWAKIDKNGTTASTLHELPLAITASMITSTTETPLIVDSGMFQTTFLQETFISDNTIGIDSIWLKNISSLNCHSTPLNTRDVRLEELVFYPNPNHGIVNIKLNHPSTIADIHFFDITGRAIAFTQPKPQQYVLNAASKGLIYAHYLLDGKSYYQKLMILN